VTLSGVFKILSGISISPKHLYPMTYSSVTETFTISSEQSDLRKMVACGEEFLQCVKILRTHLISHSEEYLSSMSETGERESVTDISPMDQRNTSPIPSLPSQHPMRYLTNLRRSFRAKESMDIRPSNLHSYFVPILVVTHVGSADAGEGFMRLEE
jgi:hypothetical protein